MPPSESGFKLGHYPKFSENGEARFINRASLFSLVLLYGIDQNYYATADFSIDGT